MPQKTTKLKSMLFVWIAVFGLAFTTVSFYDFNPKLMFVEITEEMGEDGSDIGEEDGDTEINFNPLIYTANVHVFQNNFQSNSIICNKIYATSTGYMLDLIKPPLN